MNKENEYKYCIRDCLKSRDAGTAALRLTQNLDQIHHEYRSKISLKHDF